MTQTLFDTHAFVSRLKRASISDEVAEAHMEALQDAFQGGVATRADIKDVRTEIHELRLEMKVEMKALEQRMLMRFGGMLAALFGLLVAYDRLFGQ